MVEEMYVEEQREAAELALQADRIAREQANMHNSPYEQYERNRGRSNSSLQDELHANGQPSSMPSDFRSADEGRDLADQAGPSVNVTEVQSQLLYRQQDTISVEVHNFNYEGREAKRSKTALETVSDAFNNNTTSMLIMHPEAGDNSARPPNSASPEGATDLEARKLKGKSVTAEHEQEANGNSGAFVSYNDSSNVHNVHRYDTVQSHGAGYMTSRAAPTASSGVSLTLGLRHCDANMRASSTVSVAPILEKYSNMDLANIGRMDPLDREEYLHEGRFRDVNENGQYHEIQREQEEDTGNLTQEVLPGGTGMASPEFEHHHEFNS